MKLTREDRGEGIRKPFAVVIPIMEGHDLNHARKVAESVGSVFLEKNKPSGTPGITGVWATGLMAGDSIAGFRHLRCPTLYFIGTVINALTIFERPNEAVDILTGMLEEVVAKIDVDLERAPITMIYGNQEFRFTKETESVPA